MTIALLLDIPEAFSKQINYTIKNLFFPYSEEFVFVNNLDELGGHKRKIIYCYEDSSFLANVADDNKTLYIILEKSTIDYFSNFQTYDISNILYFGNIPCLFPLKKHYNFGSPSNIITFDIFAASFFFLSCWQEYTIKQRDAHGRVPLESTTQHKLGIIRIPIVNEYLKLFEKYVRQLWGVELEYKKLPSQSNLYVALSHDIDFIDWPLPKYVNTLRNEKSNIEVNFSGLLSVLKNIWCKKDIFQKIKDIEMKYSVASTNFFLSDYPDKHKSFARSLIKSFDGTAFEVGHHISKKVYSENTLRIEKAIFESLVKKLHGERIHILRFDVNKLFTQLEECSYYYDNSLLFPEDMGYRTGFTYPHYLFDPLKKRAFNVLAIPLNLMDTTVFERKYLGLGHKEATEELFSFIDKSVSYGGVLSILFHHSFFWFNAKNRLKLYESLLKYLIESNIKVGTCRDVYFWYKDESCNVGFADMRKDSQYQLIPDCPVLKGS